MLYLNKTIIIGNLTKDVELKTLPSGTNIANFSVATNRTWKNADGEKQEEVEFHNVVVFGKVAEVISKYFEKGSQIYVEGRLKTQSWEDKDTQKKMYRTEIVLENFSFGNSKPKSKETGKEEKVIDYGTTEFATVPEKKVSTAPTKQGGTIDYGPAINPEDIPF